MTDVRFGSLDDVLRHLDSLEGAALESLEGWSPFKAMTHCAQSIECSLSGFPKNKSIIVRRWIGPMIARKFLRQGHMSHNRTTPFPKGPEISDVGETEAGILHLRQAIQTFQSYTGELKEHFAYGRLSQGDADKLHAMHVADHFAVIRTR